MRRFAVTGVVLLVVASCNEHFPRELDDTTIPAPPIDGAVGMPTDAAISDADAAIVDAQSDVIEVADAAADAEASTLPVGDAGQCTPQIASPALVDAPHVPAGTVVNYSTNPPSSGPHYPVWANFQEFSSVVPDGNLVHSMEHGAVLLLYNCNIADAACAKLVEGLRSIRNSRTTDASCDASIRVRVIIAPRPSNETVIEAAAWGQTYRADCLDVTSLTAFMNANYAKGPEDLCFAGQIAF